MENVSKLDLDLTRIFLAKSIGDRLVTLNKIGLSEEKDTQTQVLKDLLAAIHADMDNL